MVKTTSSVVITRSGRISQGPLTPRSLSISNLTSFPQRSSTFRHSIKPSGKEKKDDEDEENQIHLSSSKSLNKETQENEYEKQREENVRANMELMVSLGIYQSNKNTTTTTTTKVSNNKRTITQTDNEPFREKRVSNSKRIQSTDNNERKVKWNFRKRSSSTSSISSSSSPSVSISLARSTLKKRNRIEFEQEDDDDDEEYDTRQRNAQKLGKRIYSPKTFGTIPGIQIGKWWSKRIECSTDSIHAPTVAGISGNQQEGCWSVCLSGGYEDDIDQGDYFTYTGSGGRDLKGTFKNPKNLRTAPQSKHQTWQGKNAALQTSAKTGKPVRVVRGYKANNRYAPQSGYVYSGLYKVEKAWMEKGLAGFKVCKFAFRRLRRQDPLPVFDHKTEDKEEEEEEEKVDLKNEIQEITTSKRNQIFEAVEISPTTVYQHHKVIIFDEEQVNNLI